MERRSRLRLGPLLLKLTLSLVVTALLLEALLHFVPGLIPASYRRLYPLHGVGFFEPDLLDATPIEAVPLPLYVGSYVGPPPSDLVDIGMVDPALDLDAQRYPEVELRVDALGLPNPSVPEQANVVLVGDSFMIGAGSTRPPGLRALLAEALGETVYNLGVAGIGPIQEKWLLENVGLSKKPRIVLWFFFGGNDLTDMGMTLLHLHRGEKTYGQVHAGRKPPTWRLPAVLRYVLGSKRRAATIEPLPGLVLPGPDGTSHTVWMHPGYLLTLTKSRAQWEADLTWEPTKEVLREARDLVRTAGARFVFVYLPSKPHVLLPYVQPDAELVHRMVHFERPQLETAPADELLAQALANRGALEELLAEFCAAEDIEFVSATPCLEAQARRGELGFLAADTHWSLGAQKELLPVLLEALGR